MSRDRSTGPGHPYRRSLNATRPDPLAVGVSLGLGLGLGVYSWVHPCPASSARTTAEGPKRDAAGATLTEGSAGSLTDASGPSLMEGSGTTLTESGTPTGSPGPRPEPQERPAAPAPTDAA